MRVHPSALLRVSTSLPVRTCATSHQQPISTFLLPFLARQGGQSSQIRQVSILSRLSDVPSAYNKKIRRGRGASSGKGKTSGRGHKGQKQHGKVPAGFSGGQTPLEKVKGVKGFVNIHTDDLTTVNLDRIQSWINQGRLDISKPITVRELQRSRCLHGVKDGVKLLARNAETLTSPIHITVSRASASAIAAVEAAGGSIQTRYYTHASIRRILAGTTHPTISLLTRLGNPVASSETLTEGESSAETTSTTPTSPSTALDLTSENINAQLLHPPMSPTYKFRLPDPAGRKDIEYYRDPAHRGYLAYQVEEGQSPSLFFRPPRTGKSTAAGDAQDAMRAQAKKRAQVKAEKAEKLW